MFLSLLKKHFIFASVLGGVGREANIVANEFNELFNCLKTNDELSKYITNWVLLSFHGNELMYYPVFIFKRDKERILCFPDMNINPSGSEFSFNLGKNCVFVKK